MRHSTAKDRSRWRRFQGLGRGSKFGDTSQPTIYTKSCMLVFVKPIAFVGNSLDSLREFPVDARRESGYQIDRVQHGMEPSDWKPMSTVGSGVREIRVREQCGAYRIIYVAKFADRVYVLHCFQKRTQKTAKADLESAASRYKQVLSEHREKGGE